MTVPLKNLRYLWMSPVLANEVVNQPFSRGSSYSPNFIEMDWSHADFVGEVESTELIPLSTSRIVHTAQSREPLPEHTKYHVNVVVLFDNPPELFADLVTTGGLYDFVMVQGRTSPDADAPSEMAVGRCRVSVGSIPKQHSEFERVRIPMVFKTCGELRNPGGVLR